MNIIYKNNGIERICTDLNFAKRKYDIKIASSIIKVINFIEQATSLDAIISTRMYRFHDLKGKRDGEYAIDITNKRDGYRMILKFKETKKQVFSSPLKITNIIIVEVGNHYE